MNKQMTVLAAAVTAVLSMPAQASETFHMAVEYKPGQGEVLKAALAEKGINVRKDLADLETLSLDLSKEQFLQLVDMDGIAGIYVDPPRKLMSLGDTELIPYGIPMVQADQLTYLGGKKVCIIDSGYDLGHPDLPGASVTGADDGGAGPWNEDGVGHGTHVAGTIAALGGNDQGVAGVNPNGMDLHIVRAFDNDGAWIYATDLAGAVNECVSAGASVVSMSLGGGISSKVEQRALDKAARSGLLLVAAAGNDENATHQYPASYDSVMSVAAVDFAGNHAYFSQRTAQVEIAGPGVLTLSTVPRGTGTSGVAGVSQNGNAIDAIPMTGSAAGTVTSTLANCGLGTTPCDAAGKVCLIERGENAFGAKVANCEAGGGLAAIVYNNAPGNFAASLGTTTTSLVAVSVSQEDGQVLMANLDADTTVSLEAEADYDYKSGTSMATPHVSGVAALLWSNFPYCSAAGIRHALDASAKDLDAPGYDYKTGWGLVQAKAAADYIQANGCKVPNGMVRGGDGSAR